MDGFMYQFTIKYVLALKSFNFCLKPAVTELQPIFYYFPMFAKILKFRVGYFPAKFYPIALEISKKRKISQNLWENIRKSAL